ncbi:MAG: coproporphyrinogen dehydrogenase HemZ [Eubacteriaceae bacterium]
MNSLSIITVGHNYFLECRKIIMQYYPNYQIYVNKDISTLIKFIISVDTEDISIQYYNKEVLIRTYIKRKNLSREIKKDIIKHLYKSLSDLLGKKLPWGILTGIRPVKIPHKLLLEGLSDEQIKSTLQNNYYISEEKSNMILKLAKKEIQTVYPYKKNIAILYISIPFCPSRCNYCSFISSTVKDEYILQWYIESLGKEIDIILNYLLHNKIKISTLYIGGGTPSILNERLLYKLFIKLSNYIALDKLDEITFEGGRPDTISEEKLKILKNFHVNRISINPQTLNDTTLKNIGRRHTAKDYYRAMDIARKLGFDNINNDIIIGLENEDIDDIKYTMENIVKLAPKNITIHNLSLKKSSILKNQIESFVFKEADIIVKMNDIAKSILLKNNYMPYYLYRQKYTQGNLENIGFCKEGKEGVYNIQIMSEKISVIGLGAGSSGKAFFSDINKLERMETVKNIESYMDNIDSICNKKIKVIEKLRNCN